MRVQVVEIVLYDGLYAWPYLNRILEEVVHALLEKLMVAVLHQFFLKRGALLFSRCQLAWRLAVVGALEDARCFFSELEVDNVSGCGGGHNLLIQSDDFHLSSSGHHL